MSGPILAEQPLRPGSRIAVPALLSSVVAFSVLQSMVLPALPEIRTDLHASVTESSWVLGAFLLVSSVAAVVLGRLGDMFGKKRLLLVSVGALLAGSVLAATSTSIGVLIAGRALQGVGAAAFPLAYGLVREILPRDRVPVVLGAISSTFGIGFAVGLVLPGPFLAVAGWPAIFWFSAVVDALALVLIACAIPKSPAGTPGSVDWRGALLLALALPSMLLALSETRTWPLALVVLVAVSGFLILGLFVVVELRTVDPLVQLRLMGTPAVAAADAVGLLVGFALFGAFSIIPQFVQTPTAQGYGFGATSLQAGLLLLPTAAVMVVIGPTAGRLGARLGFARTLVAASLFGVAGYATIVIGLDSIWAIVACTTILGIAVGLSFTSMVNLIVESVKPSDTGQATGVNTILRTVGGALGAQLTATILASTASTSSPESGYRLAFAACGVALAMAAVAAKIAVRKSASSSNSKNLCGRSRS